jgi:hypothetical protein
MAIDDFITCYFPIASELFDSEIPFRICDLLGLWRNFQFGQFISATTRPGNKYGTVEQDGFTMASELQNTDELWFQVIKSSPI